MGLDVCNSLEQDNLARSVGVVAARMDSDGSNAACHDCLDILTICLSTLLAPAQFIATNPGEEAQTGPAEYLEATAIMSKGQYFFEAWCSLPCLTTKTPASAHRADQYMQDQSSPNIMAPNHVWVDWVKAALPQPLCIFKICRGCTNCRPNFFLPDLNDKKTGSWPPFKSDSRFAQVGWH